MDIRTLRSETVAALTDAVGEREARAMERVILEDVLMLTPASALANPERDIPDFAVRKVKRIVERVSAGEPLQYILGRTRFYGLDFRVTPDVLIPRPETEQLVDLIVDRCGVRTDLRVLDIGTGSGCIAIALARALKFADVTAIDISERALACARDNADALKVRVNFLKGDILDLNNLHGEWDVIVSNPPYVLESEKDSMDARVVDFEPHTALFTPDSEPLRFYTPIIDYWQTHHAAGGLLFMEINPLCAEMFKNAEILKDFYGKNRFAVYK